MSTQKLKCGGKKKKKMADGGPVDPASLLSSLKSRFAQMNNLPQKSLLSNGLAGAPKTTGLGGVEGASDDISAVPWAELSDMAGTYLDSLITSGTKEEDWRNNPLSQLRTNDTLHTAGDIAKNTAKGAGVGAAVGSAIPIVGTGIGAAVGAGVGALATGVKELFTSKKKKQERIQKAEDWANGWLGDYARNTIKSGYSKGGKKV